MKAMAGCFEHQKKSFFGTKESSSRELSCTFIRIDKRISRALQKKRTLNNVHFPVDEVDRVVAIFIQGHSISTLYRLDSVKLDNYWFSTLTQLDNVRAQHQSISFHIFIQQSLFVRSFFFFACSPFFLSLTHHVRLKSTLYAPHRQPGDGGVSKDILYRQNWLSRIEVVEWRKMSDYSKPIKVNGTENKRSIERVKL